MRGESGINLTGLYICGAISVVMLALKLTVIETWSWWRVLLPLGLFVGFNATNIVVAFIYLSFANILERPDGDEADVLEPHTFNAHNVAAMLFFIIFGDNAVRRIRVARHPTGCGFSQGKVKCSPSSRRSAYSLYSCTGQGSDAY